MQQYVVDASIIVKWFLTVGEPYVPQAQALYRFARQGLVQLYAPDFVIVEVLNVLEHRKFDAKQLMKALVYLRRAPITFVSLDKIIEATIEDASKYHLTIYDALYVALSRRDEVIVITEDKQILANYTQSHSLVHLDDKLQ